jgi:hypothetical protein
MMRMALCALGASALLVGCATDEPADDGGLREGSYAVTGFDLGSCATDAWVKSSTSTSSLVIEASADGYAMQACTDDGCTPFSPSTYSWNVDGWHGTLGGAYLTETGCLLTYVDATAHMVGDQLMVETTRWSANLAGGSCTYDEVMAMRETPCSNRVRLSAQAE